MTLAVCTTTGTREEAREIARACVEAGLAACVHIDEIESCYLWKGQLSEDTEFRLMMKASGGAYDALESRIRQLHSYEEPAIYAFPIEKGSPSYLRWVEENSKG